MSSFPSHFGERTSSFGGVMSRETKRQFFLVLRWAYWAYGWLFSHPDRDVLTGHFYCWSSCQRMFAVSVPDKMKHFWRDARTLGEELAHMPRNHLNDVRTVGSFVEWEHRLVLTWSTQHEVEPSLFYTMSWIASFILDTGRPNLREKALSAQCSDGWGEESRIWAVLMSNYQCRLGAV